MSHFTLIYYFPEKIVSIPIKISGGNDLANVAGVEESYSDFQEFDSAVDSSAMRTP